MDDAAAGEDHVRERPLGGIAGFIHRVVALVVPERGRVRGGAGRADERSGSVRC